MTLPNGFIDDSRTDWFDRVDGPNKGRSIFDAKDVRFVHVGHHRCGATFFQGEILPKYEISRHVFSDDVLTGAMFDNGMATIDRLHDAMPNVQIIMIIRNQVSIIPSAYRTYIKVGGVWSFRRYAEEIIRQGKYDYTPMLRRYFELYGVENCHVLLFEDLMADDRAFVAKFMALLGVENIKEHDYSPAKPSPSGWFNTAMMIINNVTASFETIGLDVAGRALRPNAKRALSVALRKRAYLLGNVIDQKIIKRKFNKKWTARQLGHEKAENMIRTAFHDSNRRLEKILGIDLSPYGY